MNQGIIALLAIVLGVAIGVAVGWLFAKAKLGAELAECTKANQIQEGQLKENANEKKELNDKIESLNEQIRQQSEKAAGAVASLNSARDNYAALIAEKDKRIAEQDEYLNNAEKVLKDAFARVSQESLKSANEEFLKQADSRFKSSQESAKQDWEKIIDPIKTNLKDLEKLNKDLGEKVSEEYGHLGKGIEALTSETTKLSNALKKPIVRGNWAEMVLEQILVDAGFVEGEHFVTQSSKDTEDGNRQRTDVIISVPPGRKVIIDSKAPFDAYEIGANASDEAQRREAFANHARLVKEHIKALSSKEYWRQYKESFDFTILFMPTEGMYLAAIEADPSLLQFAKDKKIYLVNPSTMLAMVALMHQIVREAKLTDTAAQIEIAAEELCRRIGIFVSHVGGIGKGLKAATTSFNEAFTSYESRLQPQITKINQLGIKLEVKSLEPITAVSRDVPEDVTVLEPENNKSIPSAAVALPASQEV